MKRWQAPLLHMCVFFLAVIPAYCQRGTFGIEGAQTADRFGGLSRTTGAEAIINGEFIAWPSKDRNHGADIIAGGELRLPTDTQNHSKEYALFGGVAFHAGSSFLFGFHAQVHRIYLPPSDVSGQIFNRARLSVLELPGFVELKFGPGKNAFIRAEGGTEFNPHYKEPATAVTPDPNLDHGYYVRGHVGYVFGKWYAKAGYETRYFKFRNNFGNPNSLYNWRSDMISGGVGFVF